MQLHNLKKNNANRKARQVGRGGSRGKTSGRGTKGQNARAGRKKRPEMRDFIKKLPKLRGRGKNSLKTRLDENYPISLSLIEANFSSGDTVSPKALMEKGLVRTESGKTPKMKILANGTISKTINFKGFKISESAKKLIEGSKGKVE